MRKILLGLIGIVCALFTISAHALPAGYTELEYIESNGEQYIDTGVYFNADQNFQVIGNVINPDVSARKVIIGNYQTSGDNTPNVFNLELYNDGSARLFMTNGVVDLREHVFGANTLLSYNVLYNKTNGTVTATYTYDGRTFTSTKENVNFTGSGPNFLLFRDNRSSYSVIANPLIMGSMAIYQNNNLVRNFIPAKRNSDGAIGMYDLVSGTFFENAGTGEFIAGPIAEIKIASTKYVETQFSDLGTRLAAAVATVNTVVTNTITQAASIATLQSGKQTRPADDTCPAGKKCLLVEGTDGQPHWYEIFDPINRWMEAFFKTNPNGQYEENVKDFRRWQGNPDFRETYIDGKRDVNIRQWTEASPARTVGGMYQTLPAGDLENTGSWAVEYDGTEGNGVNAGVVYGIAKCSSVAGPNSGSATTPSTLSDVDAEAWAELPAPYGETDREGYERANFKQCWCKMTAVGVPGADGTAANGNVYPISETHTKWVYANSQESSSVCAYNCGRECAYILKGYKQFRQAVFGLSE